MDDVERVVVVDDQAEVASALAEYLTREGYQVLVAPTGHAGLGIVRQTKVSLVLADLRLPDMDGTDLMREALRIDRSLDVVIITGHATLQSAIAAVEAGASGYLLKPIDLARLGDVVGKLSERQRLVRENARLEAEQHRWLRETADRAEKLATLSTVTRLITAARGSEEACGAVAQAATRLLGARLARVWTEDHVEGRLTVRGNWRLGPGVAEPAGDEEVMSYGRGVVSAIFASGVPAFIPDIQDEPGWLNQNLAREIGLHGFSGLPLIARGRVVGVLSMLFGEWRMFSEEEKRLMGLLADQAAIAIQNAGLFEEVETQRVHLRQILDSTSDGIMFVGRSGRIESANGRIAELLALPEVVDRELSSLLQSLRIPPAARDDLLACLPALVTDPDQGGEGEFEISTPVRHVLHWIGQPTKSGSGATVGLTLTFQDVTQEREVSRMKTDFVAFVTHQLRTPLSGLKWLLELAADDTELSAGTRSQIQDARDSAERLIHLVNTLLDISRLETGRLTVTRQATDLGDLTRGVLRDAEALIRARNHRVSVTGAVRPILADAALVRQAILSLVINAITYTPAGGVIEIRLGETLPCVLWAIQDNGVGIPAAAQPRLFEKFYRAENATTMETDGTGLGLYLVRLIIERLSGRVWCESEEGRGTTMLFTLPGGMP